MGAHTTPNHSPSLCRCSVQGQTAAGSRNWVARYRSDPKQLQDEPRKTALPEEAGNLRNDSNGLAKWIQCPLDHLKRCCVEAEWDKFDHREDWD